MLLFAAAISLIGWSVVWGRRLQRRSPEIKLGAAPLVGRDPLDSWDWRVHWQLALPIVVACAVIAFAPAVIDRWRLRWITVATGLAAAAFAVALALLDGSDGLFHGATDKTEYYANLPKTPAWSRFLETFVDHLWRYSVHVRGHPPGFTLVLKLIGGVGIHGAWPVVALSVIGVATTPIFVLVTVHRLAGAVWVRRSAPFLVLVPYAIWQITSADAFITSVAAAGVAALAIALTAPHRIVAVGASFACGLLLGAALFLTYGAVTFLILPVAVTVSRWRRWRRLLVVVLISCTAAVAVVLAFRSLGFWWFDGLTEVKKQYWAGTAKFRPWTYFTLSNAAVLLIAVGPAVLAGLIRLRQRAIWMLAGSVLVAAAASTASQYSKGEVERIWLLFFPWIVLAAAQLADPSTTTHGTLRLRTWLTTQATITILLQASLITKW
ncbi:MAG: hypothetical protein ABI706_00885 [Ilumatobacteraceae bacterium]